MGPGGNPVNRSMHIPLSPPSLQKPSHLSNKQTPTHKARRSIGLQNTSQNFQDSSLSITSPISQFRSPHQQPLPPTNDYGGTVGFLYRVSEDLKNPDLPLSDNGTSTNRSQKKNLLKLHPDDKLMMLSAIKRNRKRREEIEEYLLKLTTQETERMIAKVSGEAGTAEDSRESQLDQVSDKYNEKKDIEDWNPMEYAV